MRKNCVSNYTVFITTIQQRTKYPTEILGEISFVEFLECLFRVLYFNTAS